MSEIVCFNGDLKPLDEVRVSPINRGMMYGDGCFETLKSYSGKFLAFEDHFNRLKEASAYLNFDFDLTADYLKKQILLLINANNLCDTVSMIRFQSWRKGERGYKTNTREFDWIITAQPLNPNIFPPLKLITAKTPVIPSIALNRNFKLSNGLNYIIAAQEAQDQKADDALMLTLDGIVSETTISNIFWGKENSVYTPDIKHDLLPGVTRGLVIEMLQKTEYELIEAAFTLSDIKSADYAFTTNSVSEIRSVDQLDGVHFDSKHAELIRIKSMFEALKNERIS